TLTRPTGFQRQKRWPARAKSPVALTLTGPTGVTKAYALASMGKKPGGADAYRAYRSYKGK
ncbi:hypothetical protein LN406_23100, partial [Enterobacter hormaechei subsp. steigerwaltii]|uniref:hypothetical protein n=1 Tax=Enterobacter hormaechei TaxID=158836 RepID=UPI001E621079